MWDLLPGLTRLLGNLEINGLTNIYILFLLVMFLFFLTYSLIPLWQRSLQLKRNRWLITRELKKHKDVATARREIQFKVFSKTRWASQSFSEFRSAWEQALVRGEGKAACPVRLADFMTQQRVLDNATNHRLAEALPGVFVALGIFGTFLGLVLGLQGLRIDEYANLKEGVGQLISGLSLAFYTSLFGIIFSILFSFLYRVSVRSLEKSFIRFDDAVASLFPYYSGEYYARSIIEFQADIKQGLQTLATDLATKITGALAPAMDEVLTNHLVPVLKELQASILKNISDSKNETQQVYTNVNQSIEKMSTVIRSHFEDSQAKQSQAMEAVLNEYIARMNATFETEFKELGRVIEDTIHVQREIKNEIVIFTGQLQKQFSVQNELIDKTSGAARILSESLESLETISGAMKASAESISSTANLLEQAAEKAKEGHEILEESMEHQKRVIHETMVGLEEAWKNITGNFQGLIAQTKEVIRELNEGIGDQLAKALNAFDSKVAEVIERFSGTLFETKETIDDLPRIMAKMQDNLQSIIPIVADEKAILSDLKDSSEGIVSQNLEKAIDISKSLNETIQSVHMTMGKMDSIINIMPSKLTSVFAEFEKSAHMMTDDLKDFLGAMKEALDQRLVINSVSGSGSAELLEVMNRIQNSADSFAARQEELKATLDSFESGFQVLGGKLEKFGKDHDAEIDGIFGKIDTIMKATIDANLEITKKTDSAFVGFSDSLWKVSERLEALRELLAAEEKKGGFFGWMGKK
ncbi:anti-phage ZorAB system protein ZorA [Desulfatiglans anilini]|uniref:anti-phage ZorAB system protein ZorA n=1 Tax=Desulfatiglans anilini TaxID=90728 RepID=UPI0004129B0D|nr:anti-phage ZorAB system protein ZorA [Desulfatiglans anilini]